MRIVSKVKPCQLHPEVHKMTVEPQEGCVCVCGCLAAVHRLGEHREVGVSIHVSLVKYKLRHLLY